MKPILLALFLFVCMYADSQVNQPKLEVYVAPGFFSEQLSRDSLVPPGRQNHGRLGDVVSYGIQAAMPLKNKRFTIKGGVGFSQRHYSLNKYSLGDIFTSSFSFDSPPRRDSFNLSYVRFTNNYFQVPISFSFALTPPKHNFQFAVGINIKNDFLTKSQATVIFDSAYKIPSQLDIRSVKTIYTQNASAFVLTVEPYAEGSFAVYKNLGLFFQFKPLSIYSSPLDTRLTTSTVELFSFTFGAFFSLK